MPVETGNLGSSPTVQLDGVLFPVAEQSLLIRSPLNPFSPTTQAGNSARITDARLAVEVWDDFTGGLGQRDESGQGSTSYSEGNLDTRVPGAVALPPLQSLVTTTSFTAADQPVYVEYLRHATLPGLLLWSKKTSKAQLWRNGALTTRPAEFVRGVASHSNAYFYLAFTGTDSKVYKTTDAGATFSSTTFAAQSLRGMTVYDDQLFVYNETAAKFQYSLDGVTWTDHSTSMKLRVGEQVSELYKWMSPSGSRDAIFCVTNLRILGYEDESTDWHTYYDFEGVFQTTWPNVHMFRRDSNLYFSPYDDASVANPDKNGLVLMFNPQTSDEVGPTKRYGLPDGYVDGIARMQGGVHWLYAWATGAPGGCYCYNEFQGWSMLLDPRTVGAGTATMVGGGYFNSHLYSVTSDGRLYDAYIPDRRSLPPAAGNTYNTGTHYLRTSWTTHNQANRTKIGAKFEIDMRGADGLSGVPPGTTVTFRYRTDSNPWVSISLGTPPGNDLVGLLLMQSVQPSSQQWPATVYLPTNAEQLGAPYKRIQWEISWARGTGASQTPVLASVALYYTFWTEAHYSYQFNIDLSYETWSAWPDQTLNGYTREQLVEILLSMVESKAYHTFLYANGATAEYVPAVDLLVSSREDADMGGGIYSVTVRDLSG